MATTTLESSFAGTGSSSAAIATYSMWIKLDVKDSRSTLIWAADDGSNYMKIRFADDGNGLYLHIYGVSPGCDLATTRIFRDPGAWYHIVMAFDTAQATDTNRVKLWVNGEQVTTWTVETYIAQDAELFLTKCDDLQIGANDNTEHFDGIMSHFHCIDGTAYDASAFGEFDSTSGVWKIKTSPSVTYGTKGYFILKDGAGLTDQSGNSNNFTVTAGTLTATEDNPSNNFCTMNPLQNFRAASTFTTGNNTVEWTVSNKTNTGTLACKTGDGKFYWETKCQSASGDGIMTGIGKDDANMDTYVGASGSESVSYYNSNGYIYDGINDTNGSYGDSWTTADIIMVAFDAASGKLWFGKNGTWQSSGNPSTGANPIRTLSTTDTFRPATSGYNDDIMNFNFGNGYFGTTAIASEGTNASNIGKFEYDVPTGFTALSTKGLQE